jgi:hypothetical protein
MYQQLVKEGYRGSSKELLHGKQWKGVSFALDYLEYDLLIQKYIDLFSKKNVLVLVYEDLEKIPKDYMHSISSFLRIETFSTKPSNTHVNKGTAESQTGAIRLTNHFRKTELNPFPIFAFPDGVTKMLAKALSPLFSLNRSPLLNDDQISFIRKNYFESNQRLMQILGRDLPDY